MLTDEFRNCDCEHNKEKVNRILLMNLEDLILKAFAYLLV
jgi:hypothetical protein